MNERIRPLENIKVVELTTYVAAPMAGRMLSDLGAQVIKIEPASGDPWRVATANFMGNLTDEENPIMSLANSGKETIVLDLKQAEGRSIMDKLLGEADVFITNTRLKSLKKLGLDDETLRERFPRLVIARFTGYGDKGPQAEKPGFDNAAFWAASGFLNDMVIKSENSYPVVSPTGVGDTICGITLESGILAALLQRESTGHGDTITVSLYNTALWVMASTIVRSYERYGAVFPVERKNCSPFSTFYRCGDGEWIVVTILDVERYAPALMELLGYPGILDEERYSTRESRLAHRNELIELTEKAFLAKSCAEWIKLLGERDIVCSCMEHFRNVPKSEQAWANDYVETIVNPNGVECVIPRSPVRLASQDIATTKNAAGIGENTRDVLKRLGYTADELQKLIDAGVVNDC